MGATWSLSVLPVLLLLATSCAAQPMSGPNIDLTRFFSFSASSVCGDPPTPFEFPKNSGRFQSCNGSQFSVENALDGNFSTRWQSENGPSPVDISFTLNQPALSLRLASLRLAVGSDVPRYLHLEERRAGEQSFTALPTFVLNTTADCTGIAHCVGLTVEESLPDGQVIVFGPGTFTEPVSEVRITLDGFQEEFQNETSQYYTVLDVQLLGWVGEGYFARSLTAISVEGEAGFPLPQQTGPTQRVPSSTNETLIAGFSSRGFATFSLDSSSRVSYGWVFPSLPLTTTYQVWLSYTNPGADTALGAMVTSEELFYNARVVFRHCPPPTACHTPLVMSFDITTVASFVLIAGASPILTLTLSNIELNLDVIFAVPMAFYDATELLERDRFLQNCDFIGRSLGQGTADEDFCLQSAVELSILFYHSTYMCMCSDVGATGEVCAVYGGQCECIVQSDGFSRITGQRCDMCPFMTYLTPSGCAECSCSSPTENNCDVSTGQCVCPPLVTGRTCDSCVGNSFGDPLQGCALCVCDTLGTEYCNDTTGECVCKQGVTGESCDECEMGWFNLTLRGCEECGCDSVGSVGEGCDDSGQCTCQPNIGSLQCSTCLPGSFFFTSDGCTRCSCSGRSNECSQNPNVTSEPSEVCNCPAPYTGTSCDQCDMGWFMSDVTGECELCECNGLADICRDGDGTCVGCRGNSTGDGCNVCTDGYYDADPADPGLTCLPCPCTTVTSLDTLCTPDSNRNPVCHCRVGHEGPTCGTCSEGYFGQPPNFRCTRCNCNGNIDLTDPGSCDQDTGRCLKCINNSTGDECEMCASGFFGDATQQNCQPCDCNAPGSDGALCDSETGQCSCLPGVNGLRCEQCLPTYWNFTPSIGCQPCVCEGSAASDVCDRDTGVCECNEGVGGEGCGYCLPGFFNFSPDGCTACACGEGAVNSSCSSDGQCYCQPGVGGAKCDICQPFTFDLSISGCESCGECELNLKNDADRADDSLRIVTEQTALLMQLSEADGRGLGEVERRAGEVRSDAAEIRGTLETTQTEVDQLNMSYIVTQNTVSRIEKRVNDSLQLTFDLQPVAEEVSNHIQDIYNEMQRGLLQLGDSTAYAEVAQPLTARQAGLAGEIARNVSEISAEHSGNFSEEIRELIGAVSLARQTADEVANARNLSQGFLREAENLIGRYEQVAAEVEVISSAVEMVNETLARVQRSLGDTVDIVSDLRTDAAVVNDIIGDAQSEIESAQQISENVSRTLSEVCDAVDVLSVWIGNQPEVHGSGTELEMFLEPESENEVSGSGIEIAPDTLLEELERLREEVEGVGVRVGECEGVVEAAEQHTASVEQDAAAICSVLSASLEAGGDAVESILDFTSSIQAIEEAINVTMETTATLESVLVEVGGVGVEMGGVEMARELKELSYLLLSEAEWECATATTLISEVAAVQDLVRETEEQADIARQAVELLEEDVQSLDTEIGTAVADDVFAVESSFNVTSTIHTSLLTLLTSLPSDASSAIATLNNTRENFDLAHSAINEANTTIMEARSELVARERQLEQAEEVKEGNSQELAGLTSDLESLRGELERARRAAASIDVALRFYGNSSLGYNNAVTTSADSATRISLVFNPSETTGLMLHSSAGGDERQSLSLSLNNGSVAFTTDMGGTNGVEHVATATGVIQEDAWYQLFATREGTESQLSVSQLQGGVTHIVSLSSSPPLNLLPPNGTLYLGGSPDLVAVGYSGCLDRVVINNALVPLLLPDEGEGEPLLICGPRPPSEALRLLETGVWLLGGGSYVQVVNSLITGTSPLSIELSFRTFSGDGLLLVLYSNNMAQRLAVVLVEGRLQLQFSRDTVVTVIADTVGVVNDGEWHAVEVEVDSIAASLLVDSSERVNASTTTSAAIFEPSSEKLYIGGVPTHLQTAIGSSELSLPGCVRYLQVQRETVPLNTTHNSFRVSLGGCPSDVVPGVRFSGEGAAVITAPQDEVWRVSFSFHSTQLASLLIYFGNETDAIVVSLYHTRIRVDGPGVVLYSIQDGLNDDAWHYVTLELGNDRMNLTVDDETVTTPISEPRPQAGSDISVGGVTPPTDVVIAENFRGCIDQLAINDMLVDFSKAISLEGVALYGCGPESVPITTPLPPPPPPPLPPPPSINPNISVGLDGQDGSFLAIPIGRQELTESHIITLQFQTSSPNAMLLYTEGSYDFLAVELIRGILYYTYNLGSGRVILASVETYNDGLAHLVELYRIGRNGTMVIDGGAEVVSDVSPGTFTSLNIGMEMLFVGGTPLAFPPNNLIRFRTTGEEIPPSTLGCVLSLSVNGVYTNLSSPQASSGTEECRDFYTNVATFSGSGYLQLLDEVSGGVHLSVTFDLRTTSCTSLLLYTASSIHPDHLVLELVDGVVRLVFDNGAAPTVVEYLPPSSLCDNQWHSISLVKDGITGALSVDGADRVVQESSVVNFVSLELNSPLFVGGVPDVQALRHTVASGQVGSSSFSGCIRDVYVSSSRTGPLERDLAQATQSSGVTFHTCNP